MQLLEREGALAALAEARAAAARGDGRVVVVTGEPGIGKTSLVTAFVADLDDGARVLLGTCDDLSIPRPLGAIHDLAGSLSPALEEALAAGASPHEIHRLLLAELALPPQPTVLVLEDVHWADEATLDVITLLARRIGSLPVLLLLTCRDGEAPPGHPGRGSPRRQLLELEPLSASAVASLSGDGAGDFYAATGGNPFYVTELLASRTAEELPRSITNAVRGRVSRLSERRAAAGRARLGRAQSRRHLRARRRPARLARGGGGARAPGAARGPPALRALPPRARAQRDQVEHPDRGAPAAPRRDPRGAARSRRRSRPTSSTTPRPRAPRDVVAEYALVAARRAAALDSNREAYSHYRRASAFLDRLPAAERAAVLEELAGAAYAVYRLEDAFKAIERAIAEWTALRDGAAVGRCTQILSRFYWHAGDGDAARAKALEAIEILEPLGESVELARAYSGLAQLKNLAEYNDQALLWGERALELATKLGDERTRAHVLVNIASVKLDVDHRQISPLLEAHAFADEVGREARGDAGARQPRLRADVLGAAGAGDALCAPGARLRRAERGATTSPRTSPSRSRGCSCGRGSGTRPSG